MIHENRKEVNNCDNAVAKTAKTLKKQIKSDKKMLNKTL